jgi:hypothetical protein
MSSNVTRASTPPHRRLLKRWWPLVALLFLFCRSAALAQVALLGDLDQDGKPTVLDLQRLINHLNRTHLFSDALAPYGDLNEDGLINTNDLQQLQNAILGLTTLPNPYAAPVASAPVDATNGTNIVIAGVARPHRTILVQGGQEVVTAVADSNGFFSVTVSLQSNRVNNLFLTASNATFTSGIPQPLKILQDSEPPSLFIDFPTNSQVLTTSNIVVAGRVGDMLSGFMGLHVSLQALPAASESLPANVDVGLGNNGTFERGQVPLAEGTNLLIVTATDRLGNATTRQISVRYEPVPPGQPHLVLLSGDLQAANVHRRLAEPIVIQARLGHGQPFVNKLVTLEVTRSDGRLLPVSLAAAANPSALSNDITRTAHGVMSLQLFTDTNGEARAWWALGGDAGCGNNRVCAMSAGLANAVYFCASARPAPVHQINIGTGNHQKAEVGAFVAEPLRAWVNDSCNGIPGLPVTFTVVQGGGRLRLPPVPGDAGPSDGATTLTVLSSMTGHAEALLQLGPEAGPNLIEANYAGNPNLPATFIAYGIARDPAKPTTFTGLVLDNASQPLGGAWCRLWYFTPEGKTPLFSTYSDAQGRFAFTNALPGPADLNVLGSFASSLGGATIPFGSFPALSFSTTIIPNAENSLPRPVLLPRLNTNNARLYYGTNDLVLTCEGMAGLKMTIKANSMRLPNGTLVTPSTPATLSLNQVHHDQVPMPIPDGASPPFAWTLQPGGSTFDPPLQIEYPNMSGLAAGTVAYFLSYNHDTERFEIVASGHVTENGARIVTDPGAGLAIAGWGCNCPPYSVTGDCEDCSTAGARLASARSSPVPAPPPDCECKNCTRPGTLSGGSVVAAKDLVCLGETLTFTASGVVDSGGETACADGTPSTDPAATPDYQWTVERDGAVVSSGQGPVATLTPTKAGVHTCTFTATVQRLCPPPTLALAPKSATVVEVMSLTAEQVTSKTDSPGDPETLYVPMGMPGDTLTITAAPNPSGNWPMGQPVWTGAMGVGPVATLPIDKITTDNGILVKASCQTSEKALKVVIWNIGYREFMPCWGLDPTNQPWLSVPNGGNNQAYADIQPPGAAPKVQFKSANTGTATVAPAQAAGTPQVITVTGMSPMQTKIEASSGGMRKAITNLNIWVKNQLQFRVVIHAVTEENDDVQAIPVGQGSPNAVCIMAGGDGTLESAPGGDDTIAGTTITTGANGRCETAASASDVQVIPAGRGLPNAVCVTAGPNAFRDTVPAGDDGILNNQLTTGANGICDTLANRINLVPNRVPTPAALKAELDRVWLKQANVNFTVDQAPFTVNYDLDYDRAATRIVVANLGPDEIEIASNIPAAVLGQFHVFYVNQFVVLGNPNVLAATTAINNNGVIAITFIGDTHLNSPENITAHELGHGLGLLGTAANPYHNANMDAVMFSGALVANPCEVNIGEAMTVNP